jgi:hypothetical protein
MPGQIRQLTPDELAELETFPLPASGKVRMWEGGERNHYIFECIGVTGDFGILNWPTSAVCFGPPS